MVRNDVSSRIKKSKREFFINAVKQKKDSKYLWKNLKDISHLNQGNEVGLPQKFKKMWDWYR